MADVVQLQPNAKVVPPGIPLHVCFQAHEDNIVILRGLVRDDLAQCGDIGTQKDDLFLLRFLLSAKGNVETAAENVRSCIEFRKGFMEEINYVKTHKRTIDHDEVSRFLTAGWMCTYSSRAILRVRVKARVNSLRHVVMGNRLCF